MLKRFAIAVTLLGTLPARADADDTRRQGQLLLEHWQCTFYAADFDDKERERKHFDLGWKAGHIFYDTALSLNLPESQMKEAVSPVLRLFMNGPSVDFLLGQLHRSLRESVNEEFRRAYRDKIESGDARMEDSIEYSRKLYRQKNCELLLGVSAE
ncbi:hypothetical protein ACHFJ0_00545 [Paracoccus sp. NGMCC 1.201697]|uniref:Uncharacterized protein n=1 Tax=Paracoccus broussonetiae subsp. drimophilus TaxID=3373869 RepID=A0ABW7LF09_9RHOB